MLYTYNECKNKYKNDYQINKAMMAGEIKKLEKGIYSDSDFEFETAIISKKYPKAVFTMNSAFYYLGLTDTAPTKYYMATDKDDAKISDSRIIQYFDNYRTLELGMTMQEVEGVMVRIYGYERMLLELLRHKNLLPFDYYKEIVINFRRQVDRIDITFALDMAAELPKTDMIIRALQLEVL